MVAKIKSHQATKNRHKHRPKGINTRTFERVYWPYIPVILAIALLMLTVRSGQLATALKHPAGSVLAYAISISQQDLLNDTNQARSADSKSPLKLNSQLSRAAQAKANDMASRNYWSHDTPTGDPPWMFVSGQGYQYQKLGENLAAGFANSKSTINGWLASPEHRDNMLDADYTEVGFGFANNPDYTSTGRNGPMTIVVAYYGQPSAVGALDRNSASTLATNGDNLSNQPPAATSRAQLAMTGSPLARYGSLLAVLGLVVVGAVWISRHIVIFRRALVKGERYILHHPVFDVGLVALGLILFTLTRSAGLIL